jgi:hypothetical protein
MPTGARPRLKASLVVGVIFWSRLALAEAHADKSASFFDGISRHRSQNDCQEVGSPCWMGSIADKEERAMATRRSQLVEAMRSVDEKLGKTLHGDRLRKVAATTTTNMAVDKFARLDKNGGRRVGTTVDVLARLDSNIRSVQEERVRKVWQKGSLKPGNRRQEGAENACEDDTEWKDSLSDGCDEYALHPTRCYDDELFQVNGTSAVDKCCVCKIVYAGGPGLNTCDGAIEVKAFIDRCVV